MNSITPIDPGFDYSVVTEDFAATLTATANRIRKREQRAVTDIIEIGRELLTVKSEMEHGHFLKWVGAEFRWTPRTAQNYMAAAEWAGDKYETVSYLPPTLVYKLADKSTPEEIKAEVRADLDAGKPVDVKAIKERIENARAHQRDARRRGRHRGKPVSESTRLRREQEEAKRLEDIERREAETKAAAVEIVAILRKLPEPVFERFRELFGIASFWQVQELLNREQQP